MSINWKYTSTQPTKYYKLHSYSSFYIQCGGLTQLSQVHLKKTIGRPFAAKTSLTFTGILWSGAPRYFLKFLSTLWVGVMRRTGWIQQTLEMLHQTLQSYHPESFVMFLKPVLKYLSSAIRASRCHDKGACALQQFHGDASKSIVHINDRKLQWNNYYLSFLCCCVVSCNLQYLPLPKIWLILLNSQTYKANYNK